MNRYQYLALMVACVVVTLPLEFVLGARVYRRLGRAVAALAWPQLASADEATDARIKALEAQVASLVSEVTELKKQQSGDVETLSAQVTLTNGLAARGSPFVRSRT